jgi:hypothetical protein
MVDVAQRMATGGEEPITAPAVMHAHPRIGGQDPNRVERLASPFGVDGVMGEPTVRLIQVRIVRILRV